MNSLALAWLAETVLITYRAVGRGEASGNPLPNLPLPSEYVGTVIVFGTLGFIPGPNGQRVAGLLGWGLVIATALNLWDANGLVKKVGAKKSPQTSFQKRKNTTGLAPTSPIQ